MDRTLDITQPQLMKLALEKYKTISDGGKWMKKSEKQLEFIAMKAELQTQLQKLASKPKLKQNGDKQKKKGPKPNTGKWAWKIVPPKGNEPHKKTVDSKAYIHCPHHGDTQWVLGVNREGVEHATGCRARNNGNAGTPATPTTLSSTISTLTPGSVMQEQLLYAQALATVMASEGEVKIEQDKDDDE
jgi:hypothetical protein